MVQQMHRLDEANARIVAQAEVIRRQREAPLMRERDRLTCQVALLEARLGDAGVAAECAEAAYRRYPDP